MKKIKALKFFTIFLIMFFFYFLYSFFLKKKAVDADIKIEKGTAAEKVIDILSKDGVLNVPLFTKLLVKANRIALKAGCYDFKGNLTDREIISILERGSFCPLNFTIVEGFTVFDVANVFSKFGFCEKEEFLSLAFDKSFMKSRKLQGNSLEGYMFPDTYTVDAESTCSMVIDDVIGNFRNRVLPLFANYTPPDIVKKALKDVTVYNILKVASIVEKETSVPSEKPIIAGIIYRRLIKGMPLQCDPTVIYAYRLKGKKIDVLKGSDIRKIDSPYNTYRYKGLPPTPICNPGIESIKAALYPENTKYLYFFAVNGRHIFSKTYREHVGKMKKYYNIRK